MFRQAGSVFSFLTIIPSGSSDLQTVAKHMYLFPVIGIFELFYAILIGEVIAKFCMVLSASIGPSAWQGSNSAFIESMKDKKKLVVAGAITISVIVLFQNNAGFVALAAAIAVTLVIMGVSKRSFGGISGDIMGAINELARVSSFLVLASL
ncbi:MAG: adenosylcobinamide-GDP ribazoletransferase [Nitrosopumilaceae archaeon]|nr:adenosylcobinamide-GDP ribazoletransferase [Nitrosopumilaceae archaeon]